MDLLVVVPAAAGSFKKLQPVWPHFSVLVSWHGRHSRQKTSPQQSGCAVVQPSQASASGDKSYARPPSDHGPPTAECSSVCAAAVHWRW